MSISYNRDIPNATNSPSVDQPNMKINTNAIDQIISIDHVNFNQSSSTPGGFHKVIHFIAQGANPGNTAQIGELFTKVLSSGGTNEAVLFYENGVGNVMQLTSNFALVSATTGATFLPGGMAIQWGQGTTNGSGDATISFSPSFVTFFSASLTRIEGGGSNRGFIQFTALPSATGGTVKMRDTNGNGIAGTFLWVAIGSVN